MDYSESWERINCSLSDPNFRSETLVLATNSEFDYRNFI